jgi:hypothetical protein
MRTLQKGINGSCGGRCELLQSIGFHKKKTRITHTTFIKINNKMTVVDVGVASHSPSSELMKLVNIHKAEWTDFATIVAFLQEHLYDIIHEVHVTFDKLLIDDGETQLNCPPPPEPSDSHGALLLRTLSEQESPHGIVAKREFKVHDLGPAHDDDAMRNVEIREDVTKAPAEVGQLPILTENVTTVVIAMK